MLDELRIFSEEAVAWVNGIDIVNLCCGDDAVSAEVALAWRGWADADRVVGLPEIGCVSIFLGKHTHSLHAHFFAGPDDALGDLTAIGD